MANNGNSAGGVLVAFAVGAIAGAAVALLFAPATGEETRKKLVEKAKEGHERAETVAREGREYFNRQRDNQGDFCRVAGEPGVVNRRFRRRLLICFFR